MQAKEHTVLLLKTTAPNAGDHVGQQELPPVGGGNAKLFWNARDFLQSST